MVVAENYKAHPGLKQSGRCWYENRKGRLTERGFTPCLAAPCVFKRDNADGRWMVLGNFVDDLIVLNATTNPHAVEELFVDLADHYEVKYTANLKKFLGAEFEIVADGIYLHLHQYITNKLTLYDMADCRPAKTPASRLLCSTAPTPRCSWR